MKTSRECAICGKKFPSNKLRGTSFTEESCIDCINLMISELQDAFDSLMNEENKKRRFY